MSLPTKRTVIDTNVLVSATLSSKGNPAQIMNLISERKIQLFYCPAILDEYRRVLGYEKLNIMPETQKSIISAIEDLGILVEPPTSGVFFADESDHVFYDVARASGAILITGNLKHYPDDAFIVAPADYLAMFTG